MKPRVVPWCLGVLMVLAVSVFPPAVRSAPFEALQPGEIVQYEQEIPVNIVLIGYDKRDNGRKDVVVDKQALLDELPATYTPVVRYAAEYGLPGRDMGLEYTFKYNVIETGDSWENRFFGWLGTRGTVGSPTIYQKCYSGTQPAGPTTPAICNQTENVREITRTRYIDAPTVEKYLAQNARPLLGANAERSYTIYFINWYSRSDFQDHVYTRTNLPDPDTGFNFGRSLSSRKMIAWGGTSSRSWFYDLSAGPERKSFNYVVDQADIDGDGVEEYRMPPIWEYADGGYRSPGAISRDLGLVARYVAINLLFTSSPLYDPLVTAPGVGGDKVVHVETLQDDPTTTGTDVYDAGFVRAQLEAFQPYHRWQFEEESTNPVDGGAKRALRIFAGLIQPTSQDCASQPPFSSDFYFGALYCYFDERIAQYVPPYGDEDYVVEVFNFKTDDDVAAGTPLGFADDNWINGTQTYIFGFWSPGINDAGYGLSITTVHEVGHHIGLSHPHDGYDSETGVDYGPDSETYFAWSGDESDSVMSYIDLNYGFGRFDQDNMYRWETAGYLNASNELLAAIVDSPEAGAVAALLAEADASAAQAQAQFQAWKYLDSATNARKTYETVLEAAEQVGIPFDASPLRQAPSDAGLRLKDEPRPLNEP